MYTIDCKMPRVAKNPYTCPRCGYNTTRKDFMRKHLQALQMPCAPTVSRVVVDDYVKDIVLAERIYAPPPVGARVVPASPQPTTINIGLDETIKLDSIGKARKRGVMIPKIRKDDLSDVDVIYNENYNRIEFHIGVAKGVTYLIDILVSSYLNYYEVYLIHMVEYGTMVDKLTAYSSLVEYYKFTSMFDVKPFVQGKHDSEVLYNDDDVHQSIIPSYRVVDTYKELYDLCKSGTTLSQRRELHKAVLDIVKNSTKTNVIEINKQIMTLLNMDEEFKRVITHDQVGIAE